jgi:hypothetical protein
MAKFVSKSACNAPDNVNASVNQTLGLAAINLNLWMQKYQKSF